MATRIKTRWPSFCRLNVFINNTPVFFSGVVTNSKKRPTDSHQGHVSNFGLYLKEREVSILRSPFYAESYVSKYFSTWLYLPASGWVVVVDSYLGACRLEDAPSPGASALEVACAPEAACTPEASALEVACTLEALNAGNHVYDRHK